MTYSCLAAGSSPAKVGISVTSAISGEDALATPLQLASDLHKPSEGLFPGVAVGRLRGTLLVDWAGKGPPLLCNGGTTAH